MKLIKHDCRKMKLVLVVMLLMFSSLRTYSQPYTCFDPPSCPGGCRQDGITCWDIDDPVPLDNGLLFLIGGAVAFGLYRLNMRRQQA